jgi:hypothetical protein
VNRITATGVRSFVSLQVISTIGALAVALSIERISGRTTLSLGGAGVALVEHPVTTKPEAVMSSSRSSWVIRLAVVAARGSTEIVDFQLTTACGREVFVAVDVLVE